MRSTTGADLIKLFWNKFTHTFCNLDHFIYAQFICGTATKISGLQKNVIKFMAKKFYEIGPR